eukprot:594359-Pelagomonas_calceolata.AAC.1
MPSTLQAKRLLCCFLASRGRNISRQHLGFFSQGIFLPGIGPDVQASRGKGAGQLYWRATKALDDPDGFIHRFRELQGVGP